MGDEQKKEPSVNKYYIRPSAMDPRFSVSVFERGRVNDFDGGPYCVLAAVTREEADRFIRENT